MGVEEGDYRMGKNNFVACTCMSLKVISIIP